MAGLDRDTPQPTALTVHQASRVLEVAFDAVQRSGRHKSGIAMRFPRIARIRWDKPAAEADDVATLARMIETGGD